MTNFKASDEKTHAAGSHIYWNESFYMNFFDAAGNWGGASRIAFSPNQKMADGFICLFFPDGAVGFIRVFEKCADHLERFSVSNIEHACIEPFKKWSVRYRGPIYYFERPEQMGDFMQTMLVDLPRRELDLDIEFDAIHEVFDFHDSMKREIISMGEILRKFKPSYFLSHLGPAMRKIKLLKVMSGAQHYEHAGNIKGRIKVDGVDNEFTGFGQRDHSWGVRDMRVPTNWRWFSGQFGDELCFNAIKVEILAFRASGGYVYHNGKAEAIRDWSLKADLAGPARWPQKVALDLVSDSGKRFEIQGEALANIPVIVNTEGYVGEVNEARARFTWDGKTGYGISEFMGQLF